MTLKAPLTALIVQQNSDLGDTSQQQQAIKTTIKADRCKRQDETATELRSGLPQQLKRVAELDREKGAYSWLTALPITEHGFALQIGAFHDALCLRYNWPHLASQAACLWLLAHCRTCPVMLHKRGYHLQTQ